MSRPREFCEEAALDKAVALFWAHGYEATSLTDLTEAMGLSKSSLYQAFGSKHDLFLAAVDRYRVMVTKDLVARLAEGASPRAEIGAFFDEAVERLTTKEGRHGCLICNSAVELSAHDAEAAAHVGAGFKQIEEAFVAALRRGQALAEIPVRHDARALARYLTGVLNGLVVMAKADPNPAALRDVVKVALSALD